MHFQTDYFASPVNDKLTGDEVPEGTLLIVDSTEDLFHNYFYLKVAGSKTLVNLTSGGKSFRVTGGKIFRRVPSGTKVTLTQD